MMKHFTVITSTALQVESNIEPQLKSLPLIFEQQGSAVMPKSLYLGGLLPLERTLKTLSSLGVTGSITVHSQGNLQTYNI